MDTVNQYFLRKAQKVSFIELKKGSHIKIKDYIVKDDVPLPIVTDTLIKEIKNGRNHEEINMSHVLEGIIYILGIDWDFKYKEEYKSILYNYNSKIEEYILYRGFKHIQNKNQEDGAIFFRALTNINNENAEGIFNYALCLENIFQDFMKKGKEENAKEFLIESTNQLETILDISPDFPLAYYKLGYHYKYYEQFLKAKLIWERYIRQDKDQERLQEVRNELELITDDVDFEQGLNHLTYGEYELALEKFLRLVSKHQKWWNILYLTGLAYKGMGEYEKAIDYFYEALELGGKDINVYDELGICLFGIGDINEAIKIFNEGINLDHNDYKIIFNRGIAYLKLGLFEEAIEDINRAYKLNPNDMVVKKQMEQLKKFEEDI